MRACPFNIIEVSSNFVCNMETSRTFTSHVQVREEDKQDSLGHTLTQITGLDSHMRIVVIKLVSADC